MVQNNSQYTTHIWNIYQATVSRKTGNYLAEKVKTYVYNIYVNMSKKTNG